MFIFPCTSNKQQSGFNFCPLFCSYDSNSILKYVFFAFIRRQDYLVVKAQGWEFRDLE